jgi:hypothetical protein
MAAEVAQPAAVRPAAVQPGADPLPSRRALRDPATDASEAAEAALQAQQQAMQAQQQAFQSQPAQYAAQQPQQPQAPQQAQVPQQAQAPAQQVPSQTSAPVPTLPVQPKSFLEQAGYAPLDATPATANAWNQPSAPGQPSNPQAPEAQPNAWAQQPPPQQPGQASAAQPQQAQPSGWNQPPAQAQPAAQNQWNQPATQLPPVQQGWNAPGAPAAPAAQDGIDSLFGGGAATATGAAPAYGAPEGSWGLSPSGEDAPSGSRRRGSESSAPESAGSSTFWGWLIAISPILAAGAIGYVIVSTGYALSGWPIEAAIAAPYLLVLLFALADRSALLNLGHAEPRSPGWALLSAPVYLIVRAGETRREDGSGTALTLVWFFSFLVAIAGFVGWGFVTGHALVTGLPISF